MWYAQLCSWSVNLHSRTGPPKSAWCVLSELQKELYSPKCCGCFVQKQWRKFWSLDHIFSLEIDRNKDDAFSWNSQTQSKHQQHSRRGQQVGYYDAWCPLMRLSSWSSVVMTSTCWRTVALWTKCKTVTFPFPSRFLFLCYSGHSFCVLPKFLGVDPGFWCWWRGATQRFCFRLCKGGNGRISSFLLDLHSFVPTWKRPMCVTTFQIWNQDTPDPMHNISVGWGRKRAMGREKWNRPNHVIFRSPTHTKTAKLIAAYFHIKASREMKAFSLIPQCMQLPLDRNSPGGTRCHAFSKLLLLYCQRSCSKGKLLMPWVKEFATQFILYTSIKCQSGKFPSNIFAHTWPDTTTTATIIEFHATHFIRLDISCPITGTSFCPNNVKHTARSSTKERSTFSICWQRRSGLAGFRGRRRSFCLPVSCKTRTWRSACKRPWLPTFHWPKAVGLVFLVWTERPLEFTPAAQFHTSWKVTIAPLEELNGHFYTQPGHQLQMFHHMPSRHFRDLPSCLFWYYFPLIFVITSQ